MVAARDRDSHVAERGEGNVVVDAARVVDGDLTEREQAWERIEAMLICTIAPFATS